MTLSRKRHEMDSQEEKEPSLFVSDLEDEDFPEPGDVEDDDYCPDEDSEVSEHDEEDEMLEAEALPGK